MIKSNSACVHFYNEYEISGSGGGSGSDSGNGNGGGSGSEWQQAMIYRSSSE